jgi:hypothetical protein
MSKNNSDVNKSFVQIAGLLLVGGVISSCTGGGGFGMFGALVACYFMLVATNSIRRGENTRKERAAK